MAMDEHVNRAFLLVQLSAIGAAIWKSYLRNDASILLLKCALHDSLQKTFIKLKR